VLEPALDNVAGSHQHSKTYPRIELGP